MIKHADSQFNAKHCDQADYKQNSLNPDIPHYAL